MTKKQAKLKCYNGTIHAYMASNARRFMDRKTGEINTTALVEAWDIERSTGIATLDPNHVAWEISLYFG